MKKDPSVTEYIEQFPPEFREILQLLRDWIRQVVPDAEEAIKWSSPTFSYNHKPVCYIKGLSNHVTFAFYDGRMLRDSGGFLQGTGKYLRFIRIRSLSEMDEEQIKIWILEGFYT